MPTIVATRELEVARAAARRGGDVLRDAFRQTIAFRTKAPAELVTDADLASEAAIVELIRSEFPSHEILGEEGHSADVTAEHLWIVDPLDGTTNFAHHLPHFAVSIAYYRAGVPQCGVIWNPARDDWYETARGQGAWRNGDPVAVSPAQDLSEVLVGVGFYYDRGAMMEATLAAIADLFRRQIHGIRRFGTAALDLCQVGCGQYGAFFEYQLSPWDFAAGRLFVEEARGRVTTCAGNALPIAKTHVLASNGALHDAVLEIVRRRLPPAR
jgi:myo-inositol-1(or 4)-monophosphatase